MPSFAFSKLIPGGNATILLPDPDFSPERLPDISARLMDSMHIQAEQAGALYRAGLAPASLPGVRPDLPHLQMMGGEFCVNATRAAALLLARQGLLRPLPGAPYEVWGSTLTVSGMDRPVPVAAAFDPHALEAAVSGLSPGGESGGGALNSSSGSSGAGRPGKAALPLTEAARLYCAARIDCAASAIRCLEKEPGVTLVNLPGIQHLLVDAALHPLPGMHSSAWKTASAAWRAASGLAGSPASGVIWYERRNSEYRIWPAVEVRATGTEHLETACGSASLAMALARHFAGSGEDRLQDAAPVRAVNVFQPSDEALRVLLIFSASHAPKGAWIAGPVRLAAQGTAYL